MPSSLENRSALPEGGGGTTVCAEEALKGVERARERARIEAGLAPAWYGPAAAVTLVLPSVVQAWSSDRGGWATAVALLVSLLGLAAVFALVRAARRAGGSTGDAFPLFAPEPEPDRASGGSGGGPGGGRLLLGIGGRGGYDPDHGVRRSGARRVGRLPRP